MLCYSQSPNDLAVDHSDKAQDLNSATEFFTYGKQKACQITPSAISTATPSTGFYKLPREIRDLIYDLALPRLDFVFVVLRSTSVPSSSPITGCDAFHLNESMLTFISLNRQNFVESFYFMQKHAVVKCHIRIPVSRHDITLDLEMTELVLTGACHLQLDLLPPEDSRNGNILGTSQDHDHHYLQSLECVLSCTNTTLKSIGATVSLARDQVMLIKQLYDTLARWADGHPDITQHWNLQIQMSEMDSCHATDAEFTSKEHEIAGTLETLGFPCWRVIRARDENRPLGSFSHGCHFESVKGGLRFGCLGNCEIAGDCPFKNGLYTAKDCYPNGVEVEVTRLWLLKDD